jgi:hypothetical protein
VHRNLDTCINGARPFIAFFCGLACAHPAHGPVEPRLLSADSVAYDVLRHNQGGRPPANVASASWYLDYHASWHTVQEHSKRITSDLVLTAR